MRLLRREVFCLGLDLSSDQLLRGVLVRQDAAGPEVLGRAQLPVQGGSQGLQKAIEGLVGELGAERAPAVLGLGGERVLVRPLRLPPALTPDEIREAVKWQLVDLGEGYATSFTVLGRSTQSIDVLAAAVQEDYLQQYLAPFAVGLRLVAVDLRVCALWRAVTLTYPAVSESALAVVENTPSGARVLIGREYLEFAREIPAGGNVAFEVRRTLSYYRTQYGADVTRLLLVGVEPVPGLEAEAATLEEGLLGPEYTAALGLALYPFRGPGVNFLPGQAGQVKAGDTSTLLRLPRAAKLAGVAAVFGLAAFAALHGLAAYYAAESRALDHYIIELKPVAEEAARVRAQTLLLKEWTGVVREFIKGVPARSTVLDDVRRALPREAWLTKLELAPAQAAAGNKPISTGPTAGQNRSNPAAASGRRRPGPEAQLPPVPEWLRAEGYALSVAAVGAFRDNVAVLPHFAAVKVSRVQWDADLGAYAFTVEAKMKGGVPTEARRSQ